MAMKPCMGRKKRWPERVGAKFAAGTLDRIAVALADGEERTAFIREAVERELERREKAAAKTILRIPTIPARDSNLKAATIPIEGGQYWPVGTFMGSQRW